MPGRWPHFFDLFLVFDLHTGQTYPLELAHRSRDSRNGHPKSRVLHSTIVGMDTALAIAPGFRRHFLQWTTGRCPATPALAFSSAPDRYRASKPARFDLHSSSWIQRAGDGLLFFCRQQILAGGLPLLDGRDGLENHTSCHLQERGSRSGDVLPFGSSVPHDVDEFVGYANRSKPSPAKQQGRFGSTSRSDIGLAGVAQRNVDPCSASV